MEKKQVHNLSGTSYLSRFSASPRTSSNRQGTSSPNSVLVPPLKPCDSSESSPGSNKKRSPQVASAIVQNRQGTPSSSNSVSVPPQKSRNSPEPSAGNNKKRSPQAALTIKPNHQGTSSSLNSVLVPPLKPRDSPESSPGSYKKRSPQAASAIVSGSEPATERGKEKSRSITARLVSRIPIRKSSVDDVGSPETAQDQQVHNLFSISNSSRFSSSPRTSSNRQGTPSSPNSVLISPRNSRDFSESSPGSNKKRSPRAASAIEPNRQDTSSSLNSVSVPPLKLRDSPESSPGSNKKRSPQAASAIVQNRQGTPSSSNSVSVSPQKSRNSPEPSAGSNKKGLSQAASAIVSDSERAAERGKEKSRSITARLVSRIPIRKSSVDDVGSPETAQDQQVHNLFSISYSSRFSASPRTSSNRQGTPSSPNSVLVSPRNSRDFSESSPGSNKKRSPRAAITIEPNRQDTSSSLNSVSVPPLKLRNSPESSPGSNKKRSPQAASAIVQNRQGTPSSSNSVSVPPQKSRNSPESSPGSYKKRSPQAASAIEQNCQGTPSSSNSVSVPPQKSRNSPEPSAGSNKKGLSQAASAIVSGSEPAAERGKEKSRSITARLVSRIPIRKSSVDDVESPETAQDQQVHNLFSISYSSRFSASPRTSSNRQGTPSSPNSVVVSPRNSRDFSESSPGSNKKRSPQAASAIEQNCQGTPSSSNSVSVPPQKSRNSPEPSAGNNKKRSPQAATTIKPNHQGTSSSLNSVLVPPLKPRDSPESSPGSYKKRSPQAASAIEQNCQGAPSSSNSVSVPPQKSRNSPEPSAGSNKKGLSQAASAIVSGSEPAAERGKESPDRSRPDLLAGSHLPMTLDPQKQRKTSRCTISPAHLIQVASRHRRGSSNRQGTPSSPNSVFVSPRNSHDSPESSPGSNKKRSRQAASVSVGQVDPDQREHRATPACDPRDPLLPVPTDRLERNALILKGPFQPTLDKYPVKSCGKSKRSFIKEWFKTYSWLEYSIEKDSCFCFFCRIFPHENSGKSGHSDAAFTQKGFDNWKRE
ncbi:serine/arginine repetitive matrix protein 1-like isoform X2 [Culex quinquefasciatus]|nr:serine/arginine repetitive matrix protein 1-like isoform X2 [Culex quinquefasciatus]